MANRAAAHVAAAPAMAQQLRVTPERHIDGQEACTHQPVLPLILPSSAYNPCKM